MAQLILDGFVDIIVLQSLFELPIEIITALIAIGGILIGLFSEHIRNRGEQRAQLRQIHAEVYLDKRADKLIELLQITHQIKIFTRDLQSECIRIYESMEYDDYETDKWATIINSHPLNWKQTDDLITMDDAVDQEGIEKLERDYRGLQEQWWTAYQEASIFVSGESLDKLVGLKNQMISLQNNYSKLNEIFQKDRASVNELRRATIDFYHTRASIETALSQALTITRHPLEQYDKRGVFRKVKSIVPK